MGKPADTFIRDMNIKYREKLGLSKNSVLFYNYDEFSMWLYYDYYKLDFDKYYCEMEENWKEYSDNQALREKRKRDAKRRYKQVAPKEDK